MPLDSWLPPHGFHLPPAGGRRKTTVSQQRGASIRRGQDAAALYAGIALGTALGGALPTI